MKAAVSTSALPVAMPARAPAIAGVAPWRAGATNIPHGAARQPETRA